MTTKSRHYFGGGSSMRREWGGDKWTEERRFTDYAADGRRIEYVVTDSYDCGTVTNSVSTYDLLGRLVSSVVRGANGSTIVTVNAYDGTTARILSSTRLAPTLSPRISTYLYDDFGEQVGTVLDGVSTRTDTMYETEASNVVWRVETTSVTGSSTNSLTIVRTQLTGLSNSCRRHTVTLTGTAAIVAARGTGVLSVDDSLTESLVTYDPSTGIETETVTSAVAPTIIRRSLHGILLSTETTGETIFNSYDAFGRLSVTFRQIGRDALVASAQSFEYSPCGDLISTHTYTNNSDSVTESYAYDMLGNRIATTDALGNAVFRSYDPFGQIVTEWGATYPVRYTYDTQGRRTSLSTTRDGVTWDTTTWAYDPLTGNCLSKTYADGSTVAYTYTPDSLPLRTTYASGRWKENVYDERRQVVGVIYSDDEVVSFAYDEFGNEISASNEIASVVSLRSEQGDCTNDTAVVGEEVKTTCCTFDAFSRLTGIDGIFYDYNADGFLASISNGIALVEYAYTPDRLDAGYTLTLSNGVVFSRSLVRDDFRRSLVAGIANTGGGATTESLAYAYDALNRPASRNGDTFGYNARSEVTAANVSGIFVAYDYDEIGNSSNWTANRLNQYTKFTHDADGNMLSDGNLSFTYDAANRLKTASSNGVLIVTNFYDAKSHRVKKVTPEATTTFFYDGWNLVEERIAYTNGISSTIRYFWGKDLSGTLQGAGGVGGLLYLTVDGAIHIPCYDNNGNVTRYCDANGNTVAQYTYDAFGNIISQSGPLADFFRYRFSTKYYDLETGLYYYGYRFYSPSLMRWLSRDPIGVRGGVNLYGFCGNNPIGLYDADGCAVRISQANRVIIVTLNITIYYANRIELNARTDLARITRRIKKQIEEKWNAQTWRYGCCM